MKKSIRVMACAAALVIGSTALLAAEETKTFGWQKGKSEAAARNSAFEKVSSFTTDEEREAYMESLGIGGDGPFHNAAHPDTPGYDSKEMKDMQAAFSKVDFSKMTEEEIKKFFESLKK